MYEHRTAQVAPRATMLSMRGENGANSATAASPASDPRNTPSVTMDQPMPNTVTAERR